MTKELLRWEDSPGLEHHCPKCQTPLNNPRAKHTCYFKHVEICPMFHQHFFMIGQAHNCDTCRRNNNAHDERHRQLALLLRELAQLQKDQGIEPIACPVSPFTPTSTSKRPCCSLAGDDDPETTPKLKKRERKKAKKRIKALKGGDALTTAQIAAVASALHPSSRNDSTASTSSSSTNTTETSNHDTDTPASPISPISPFLPSSPATPTTPSSLTTLMNVNKSFHPDVNGKLNSSRMTLQTSLLHILDTTYPSLDTSLTNALSALNIPDISDTAAVAKLPKCVVEIMAKITEAVREDLWCTEGEVRRFHLREAAWYRFVNRSVLALREE